MSTPETLTNSASAGWQSVPYAWLRWVSFDIQPHQHIQIHRHQTAHLCIVQDGCFEEYDGSNYVACSSGTVRLSASGSGHELMTGSDQANGKILELSPGQGYNDPRFWKAMSTNRYISNPEIHLDLNELTPLLEESHQRPYLKTHLLVRRLMAQIAFRNSANPLWYNHIREYLESNFRNPALSLLLAREAGLHRTHFARQFFRAFGCTVSEYVGTKRLDHAMSLLLDTNFSLSAIAAESAYSDQSHLTRSFKHRLKTTPGKFRKISHEARYHKAL